MILHLFFLWNLLCFLFLYDFVHIVNFLCYLLFVFFLFLLLLLESLTLFLFQFGCLLLSRVYLLELVYDEIELFVVFTLDTLLVFIYFHFFYLIFQQFPKTTVSWYTINLFSLLLLSYLFHLRSIVFINCHMIRNQSYISIMIKFFFLIFYQYFKLLLILIFVVYVIAQINSIYAWRKKTFEYTWLILIVFISLQLLFCWVVLQAYLFQLYHYFLFIYLLLSLLAIACCYEVIYHIC